MKCKIYIFILLFFLKFSFCNANNILILSIPKCGTHLAAKAAELLTNRRLAAEVLPETIFQNGISVISDPNKIFRSHLRYEPRLRNELIKNNFKALFIFRDPRDQIISSVFWMKERLSKNNKLQNLTIEQLVDFQIKRLPLDVISKYDTSGMLKLNPTNFNIESMIDYLILKTVDYYSFFLKWKNIKRFCTVKFENLVGKRGNGSDILQRNEVKRIANYLGINSETLVNHCIKNLYGDTFTFREGKIGSWKKYFTLRQINNFKKVAGNLLIELGYERDLEW